MYHDTKMMDKLLFLLLVAASATIEAKICGRLCDGASSHDARNPRVSKTEILFGRKISLHLSDQDNVGFASISNGDPTDQVWIDRSFDGGKTWAGRLVNSVISSNTRAVQTPIVNIDGENTGQLRACGKAGNRVEIACTPWLRATKRAPGSPKICGKLCDGDGANQARNPRIAKTEVLFSREISLHLSDDDNVGFASISNGDPGDEVWIDRSFDGSNSWEGRIGNSVIPSNSRAVQTPIFNVDGNVAAEQVGILRACGKASNRDEISCTPWYRTTVLASFPAQAALTTMMMYYKNSNGQFSGMGWWNNANALTGLIDYIKVTGDRTFQFVVDTTFEKNRNAFEGNFCNDFLDDTGWWGLAWVDAYDITGDQKYLQMAEKTAECMHAFIDGKCGGGVYWSNARTYKNAITNELFIKLAAALHNRINGDTKYLDWAVQIWQWFDASGMINNGNLINDGLNTEGDCKNNNDITWTYNQGVILGALVQLNKATGDANYLNRAKTIANAATSSTYLNNNGILHEPCDHDNIDCGGDGQTFKGVFARNIGELNEALPDHPYSSYIKKNGESISKNGNSFNQFGLHYEGPFEFFTTATQQSAFEMLVAHERVNRQ